MHARHNRIHSVASRHPALQFAAALVCAFALPAAAQTSLAQELPANWFRTELLVFVRDNATQAPAEQWNPLPNLAYPDEYRFLLDPDAADRRVLESQAYSSEVDEQGLQRLTVPTEIEALDIDRPDDLLVALPLPYDPNNPLDPNNPVEPNAPVPGDGPADAEMAGVSVDAAPDDETLPEPAPQALLALPYTTLSADALEFRAQARSLRRRGARILFHAAWWAPLGAPEETLPIVLDRSGDPDQDEWPELQGSIRIFLTRYLHIQTDLWLNTEGNYLPEGWQIPAPPLARASVGATTLAGASINPWDPTPTLDALLSPWFTVDDEDPALPALPAGSALAAESMPDEPAYPWRHAIRHSEERRMRSGEIHYLDHPVIGVVLRIVPASSDAMPLASETDVLFRERHGLPTHYLELNEPPET